MSGETMETYRRLKNVKPGFFPKHIGTEHPTDAQLASYWCDIAIHHVNNALKLEKEIVKLKKRRVIRLVICFLVGMLGGMFSSIAFAQGDIVHEASRLTWDHDRPEMVARVFQTSGHK